HRVERRDGTGLPGRLHHHQGPVLRAALRGGAPGLPAGDHRRLDRPEAACPRPVHGRREVGNPRRVERVGEGMTALSPMPYTAPSPACSVAELIQRVQAGASGLGYQVSPTPDGFVMVAHRNAQVIAGSGTIQVTHHVRLDEVTKT